ncbi:MAG: ATP-binding cassette domain-containing protein [Caldilinea sp. CFX5]|nr:ATP-binding cassette domain-containing protein [Caldilinea sp. CFX5]
MAVGTTGWFKNSKITPNLIIGIVILAAIVLVGILGPMLVDESLARVGGVKPNLPPSAESYFGSDSQGRDVFTTLILAIPPTLRVGVIAGVVSVVVGLILGLLAGFFSGWTDAIIRVFSDVLIAVPALAFTILVVSRMEKPSIVVVAVIVGLLTWSGTARGIRAQVLTIRERSYTAVARANGESEVEVLFREVMPNLLPLMMASFIGAVTAGIGVVMALEVLGLGNNVIPTLGMMIFWSQRFSAVLRGMWWWWSPPIITIAAIFIGLFFLSSGLDRYINPNIPVSLGRRKRRLPTGVTASAVPPVVPATDPAAVLQVKNLQVVYETARGVVRAVDDVSFTLQPGERMGLIGESGSGKTTMVTALMRLTRPPAYIAGGQVLLEGKDLLSISDEALRKLRLKEIALMPQAAMNSLNPVIRVGPQIKDGFRVHGLKLGEKELDEKVTEVLGKVGLRPEVANRYPHQLSGGMKQRVAMAVAISLSPKVIIADEPTSALDVVVQKQVMLTLSRLQQELDAAVLLIGHDMGLITQFADSIGVLYAGKLVERGRVADVLENPLHPYTRMLIDSLPDLEGKKELFGIRGLPPELLHLPKGCAFHSRCPFAMDRCKQEIPVIQSPVGQRQVACHLYPQQDRLPVIKLEDQP